MLLKMFGKWARIALQAKTCITIRASCDAGLTINLIGLGVFVRPKDRTQYEPARQRTRSKIMYQQTINSRSIGLSPAPIADRSFYIRFL